MKNRTGSKAHGKWSVKARAAIVRIGVSIALTVTSSIALATHVGLLFDNLVPVPQVMENNGGGSFYNLQISTSNGRATVTGGLFSGDFVPVGKRAVGLLGFSDDLLLLDAQAASLIQIDPNLEPAQIQLFALEFYSDPITMGFDPTLLLAGYATNFLIKTFSNTCPFSGDCIGTPSGYFDLTTEMGNPPDTLRLGVRTSLVSAPATHTLALTAFALLGLFSRRRAGVARTPEAAK